MNKQFGFSTMQAVIIAGVTVLVTFLILAFVVPATDLTRKTPQQSTSTPLDPTVAPEITAEHDLDTALATLDAIDLDANTSELASIEEELNAF